MRTVPVVVAVVALAIAGCGRTEPPHPPGTEAPAGGFEGMTESEIVQKLGTPLVKMVYSGPEVHSIANKTRSVPSLAEPLAQLVAGSPDLDIPVKCLIWHTNHLGRIAALHEMNGPWIVFHFAEYQDDD